MRSDIRALHLPAGFFKDNRERLLARLPERCFVVVFAGKTKSMTRDTHYRFMPNRNFFYLTGIEQEDTVLIIEKDYQSERSTLFIYPKDPLRERWVGQKIDADTARDRSGVDEVRYLSSLPDKLHKMSQNKAFTPVVEQDTKQTHSKDFLEMLQAQGHTNIVDIGPILTEMRMCKQSCEIDMIQKAIDVCREVLSSVAPLFKKETTELEIFSAIEYELAKRGCLMPAFPTIVAGNQNVFYLHHPEPSGELIKKGALVQIDFGAMVGGLCSDISRVFPVGGSFSEQQRILYDMVRKCQERAFSYIRPGLTLAQINSDLRTFATTMLSESGVMNTEEDVGEYVWHNTVHHLGMDVHDVCDREKPLDIGAVLAVEPGIYIPKWGIGFRIEDDVEIVKDGCCVRSEHILREAKDIEHMVLGWED